MWQCSAKNIPADSLPPRDSAKNMVWSAQQLSFLIEHCLMKDVAFCLRLQPLQCFCAWNASNCQRSFFLCQHSQLCQSLACFHKQRLWTKFPTPLLAADVFNTWTISKHINSRTTTSAQRINTYVTSMKMIHEERTIKNVITPPRTPPTNTQRINTYVTSIEKNVN